MKLPSLKHRSTEEAEEGHSTLYGRDQNGDEIGDFSKTVGAASVVLEGIQNKQTRALPMTMPTSTSTSTGTKNGPAFGHEPGKPPHDIIPPPAPIPLAPTPRTDPFDFSMVGPVRKKANPAMRPKRIIEVIELLTGQVMVCYRGITDVCRSLDLEKKYAHLACDKYGKPDQINFTTFTLRYANPGTPISAYVVGDHPDDYKKRKKESQVMLRERFQRIFEEDKKRSTLVVPHLPKTQSEQAIAAQQAKNAKNKASSSSAMETTQMHLESITMHDKLPVDINQRADMNDLEYICIICQNARSQIVYEPCLHCVLCTHCAVSHCHRFCPICRSTIQRRTQPKTARLVRPRIYSAYSFM